jgi:hypothetical protein
MMRARRLCPTRTIASGLAGVLLVGTAHSLAAQPLFKAEAPVELTLTTNLRDLVRERDSTSLRWFATDMRFADDSGTAQTLAVRLRARGHFRRQARNCAFPPLSLRADREVRDGSLLQGNPRLKIVTPCRPGSDEYQQYILAEYLLYRTLAVIQPVHHRTRLARITYRDSTDRVRPIEVTGFFLEVDEEVADEHKLALAEQQGALWADVDGPTLDRLSLFEFWIGNTDWSLAGLHNIVLYRDSSGTYIPVPYDFDWSGAVNARYSFPNAMLGIRSVRERLHRGPCRTAEQWAPTIAHYRERRAAIDSVWATPIPGLEDRTRRAAKEYLDQLWPILDDPRRFKRAVIDVCQKLGN